MLIEIPAWREGNYLSLEEILQEISHLLAPSRWYLKVIETAPEPGCDALNNVNSEESMSLSELFELIAPRLQIIDGDVVAVQINGDCKPYLIIRAIDSTSWDINTNVPDIIGQIKLAYPEAIVLGD